jgi:hypothetical protein
MEKLCKDCKNQHSTLCEEKKNSSMEINPYACENFAEDVDSERCGYCGTVYGLYYMHEDKKFCSTNCKVKWMKKSGIKFFNQKKS